MTGKRPPCADHRLDFTSIHARSGADVIAEARAVCAACPLLLVCLDYLETTEPAGLAGGMLPAQRARWRKRDGISEPRALELHEVSEAAELEGPFLDALPSRVRHAPFAMPLVDVVRRLTEAGYTAEEIAERLNGFNTNARSVRHLRSTQMTEGVTARR